MNRTVAQALVMSWGWASLYAQLTPKNMGLGPEASRKCAEQGDADCQAKLGWFYEDGIAGVKEDHVEAIKWYRRAAEQGLIAAQIALAATYAGGYRVPQDRTEAAKWYQRAAERGDAGAHSAIALVQISCCALFATLLLREPACGPQFVERHLLERFSHPGLHILAGFGGISSYRSRNWRVLGISK